QSRRRCVLLSTPGTRPSRALLRHTKKQQREQRFIDHLALLEPDTGRREAVAAPLPARGWMQVSVRLAVPHLLLGEEQGRPHGSAVTRLTLKTAIPGHLLASKQHSAVGADERVRCLSRRRGASLSSARPTTRRPCAPWRPSNGSYRGPGGHLCCSK